MGDIGIFEIKAILYVMNRLVCLFVLLVVAMLTGCSSHAPSAARFMSAKPNSIYMGFGGGGFWGDDNSHRDEKGKDEAYRYKEPRFLLDGVLFFRNDHFLFGLSLGEHSLVRLNLGFVSDYFGVQGWGDIIVLDKSETNWKRPFGIMTIEQYPITSKLKVGVNQFFAYNSYSGVLDECCSINLDYYMKFYGELGVGAYVSYDGYSLEFRYGNELGSDNQRFYLDFSVMFDAQSH